LQLRAASEKIMSNGLVDLDLVYEFTMSYETWVAVCDSLKTDPTLEFEGKLMMLPEQLHPAQLKVRMQSLVDMLKVNTLIHTIPLDYCFYEHELYRGRSFRISRRISSSRAFLPSKKLSQLCTVERCWDELFVLYEPIAIAF
jgi:hypothetical protein